MKVRNLQPGQWFILLRTGETYQFIRRDHGTPYGTRYVVKHSLFGAGESTLHHSCHVALVNEGTISHE